MTMHGIILPLVLLYFAIAAVVVLRFLQRRRAAMRLVWPPSITQRQMEHQGARFLERMGWQISVAMTPGTQSVLHCSRPGSEMFVLFLRDGSFFRRMLLLMTKHGPHLMKMLVIVPYDPPSEAMVKQADEVSCSVVHFRHLPSFTDCKSARQPGLDAALEMKRRVRAVSTP